MLTVLRPAVALVGILIMALPARAGEALVAVAANFTEVAEALAPGFQAETGHVLTLTTGSTGKLYAQITAGAPYDALLAADQARPELLESEGRGVSGSRFTYASGRLVLWSADAARIRASVRETLEGAPGDFLAIANPDLAPYGMAARQVLTALELWDGMQDRIVMGQNIGQAFSMTATGNAPLGLVAKSQALSPRMAGVGGYLDVPADLHDPIRQDAILLDADNAAAIAFLSYLRSAQAKQVISDFGYGVE